MVTAPWPGTPREIVWPLTIHVSAGLKAASADGRTSRLRAAAVQFITELVIVEAASPPLLRVRQANLYDVPLLRFGPTH
ncbi:hypothetical protein [Streptomyces syringium]|uniref:hypothetical protein n=1 Tax=Streptomyces syringium TaxID=76729 RepID=UPI00340591D9